MDDFLATYIPCVRHGHAGISDPKLRDLLVRVEGHGHVDLASNLASLLDYEGQLWATWKDEHGRATLSAVLADAWRASGSQGKILQLINSDDGYDFQENIMNNAENDL